MYKHYKYTPNHTHIHNGLLHIEYSSFLTKPTGKNTCYIQTRVNLVLDTKILYLTTQLEALFLIY